jgi:hypothetical protein
MSTRQLEHVNGEYIEEAIVRITRDSDLEGFAPVPGYEGANINDRCSLEVSKTGVDMNSHSCVLQLRTLREGLAKLNGLTQGAVYITLRKSFSSRCVSRTRVAEDLRGALLTHGDECMRALGRGEHVHESSLGKVVESVKLLMQQYAKPARASASKPKPSKPKPSTKVAPSATKLTMSSDAARNLRRIDNAIAQAHEAAKHHTAETRRAARKNAQLEKEQVTVANNLKIMAYAERHNVTIHPQVGDMSAEHALYTKLFFPMVFHFLNVHDSTCT